MTVLSAPINKRAADSGDMTHFDTGLGSCGFTNSDSDWVVALSLADAPGSFCGQQITISWDGVTAADTAVDTRMGCVDGKLEDPAYLTEIQYANLLTRYCRRRHRCQPCALSAVFNL